MKLDTINLVGQIADLKEREYKNSLLLAALAELLITKGLFTQEDLLQKSGELDFLAELQVQLSKHTESSL